MRTTACSTSSSSTGPPATRCSGTSGCPAALPYFLAGLRISGGLALIGAVVAKFVAGTGGSQSGLAYRILEVGYTLQIPRMFAALFLVSASGVLIFVLLSAVSWLCLRHWHVTDPAVAWKPECAGQRPLTTAWVRASLTLPVRRVACAPG